MVLPPRQASPDSGLSLRTDWRIFLLGIAVWVLILAVVWMVIWG